MSLREIKAISPSQVELHETCNRKWWLNKVMGKAIPQHPSAALGELVHKGQEDYLATGDEKKVHPLAVATLPILRSMRERGVKVEHTMQRQLRNGLLYNGRIDILDLGTKDENLITVADWKTTGSPAYAKTADELRGNIQMLSYAYEATILDIDHRGPTATTPVVLSHIVIPTKGSTNPFVTKTDPPLTVPEIRAGWSKIQTISDRMLETSKLESPDAVPGNKSACSAFGGCPFRETCAALERTPPLSVPVTAPTVSQENNTMPAPVQIRFPRSYAKTLARIDAAGLLDAATATVEDVAGVIEAPVEQVAALQTLGEEGYTTWAAAGFPDIVAFAASRRAPAPAAKTTPTPPVNRGVMAPEARAVQTPAVVAPVAEVKAEPTEEEQAELWELLLSRGWSDTDIEGMSDEAFDAAVKLDAGPGDLDVTRGEDGQVIAVKKRKPAPAPTPAAEVKPEPRRRGRPAGSKNKPKEAPEVSEVEAAPVEAVEAQAEVAFERPPAAEVVPVATAATVEAQAEAKPLPKTATAPVVPVEARSTLTLFIDCLPVKGIEYRRLEDVLAPIATQAASSWKNPKTGQVETFDHYTLIPFGGGVQMVAAGVMRNISRPEFSGVLVANTSLPLTAAVLEVLLPVADVVVRGVR